MKDGVVEKSTDVLLLYPAFILPKLQLHLVHLSGGFDLQNKTSFER